MKFLLHDVNKWLNTAEKKNEPEEIVVEAIKTEAQRMKESKKY